MVQINTDNRYGGLAGLSGGLIGPESGPRDYRGSLAETPVFLSCGEITELANNAEKQARREV